MYIPPFHVPDTIRMPADFRGMDSAKAVYAYSRMLPHWRQDEATYFVTFRTEDSLPEEWWRKWMEDLKSMRTTWERSQGSTKGDELVKARDRWESEQRAALVKLDLALDAGAGRCPFRNPDLRSVVCDALLHFEGSRSRMFGFVVMPNHVHLAVKPLSGTNLEDLLHSWKSYTAKVINQVEARSGVVWQAEYFDRIIRDESHLRRVVRYLARNPISANCGSKESSVWISPDLLKPEDPGMIRELNQPWPESPW